MKFEVITPMKVLVDADACPVTKIVEKVAKEFGVCVVLVTDVNHLLESDYAEVITVGQGKDAVDYALINRTDSGDIVITQDYGVATLALAKGAAAIDQNGRIYSDKNIDRLLFERHLAQKQRRASGRFAHVPARLKENDELFERQFRKLLQSHN
jgi:uncharacterized protein YaiI (UPF0178 family)